MRTLEIKILGIATTGILSEIHLVSKTSVWIKKFEEKLPISAEKKPRKLVAIDETIVKANKKHYYVYAAIDVERNELIFMRVYTTRNYLTARHKRCS